MYYLLEKILFVGLFDLSILFTGQKKKKFEKNYYILRELRKRQLLGLLELEIRILKGNLKKLRCLVVL
jgi:hypothetical protein